MTTRAGFIGLLTGLAVSLLLVYPLALARASDLSLWILAAGLIMLSGGWLAGRWSASKIPLRSAALGALSGGLAGTLVFCLLGAAVGGLNGAAQGPATSAAILRQTNMAFLFCFLGGSTLGLLGGWLACPKRSAGARDAFDKSAPQMALNVAITAVPASIVAAGLAALVFAPLAGQVADLSLALSLWLVLLAQLALTLIVPHEARQAEHLCGMDEVRMAAYVAIGAAPLLALLLFFAADGLFLKPLVIAATLFSAGLSLVSLQTLRLLILPARAIFPAPQDARQKREAKWFGTIADSRGPRLTLLCIGCGLLLVLPLQVSVIAPLINLKYLLAGAPPVEVAPQLFRIQALTGSALMAAAAATLTGIYLFYLNLGRWFVRWNSPYTK